RRAGSRPVENVGATHSANPDGSDFRVLSDLPEGAFDIDPKASPNGRRILFERDTDDGAEIVLMRAGGSGERTIDTGCVDPCADDIGLNWAPGRQARRLHSRRRALRPAERL